MIVVDVVAVVLGVAAAAWLLISAIRTIVIPRPERVWITIAAFEIARRVATWTANRTGNPARRHRVLGAFAPTVLISLPLIWSIGLIASFAAIFWGLGVGSVGTAIELSGSSLTTLGFVPAPTFATRLVAILEALLGLAIVALMISFLPTLYGTFSRREVSVERLTTRAGAPPNPVEFIVRLRDIGRLDQVGERWEDWEDWFVELGETHTTFPALVFFRSADSRQSWISAAEAALDTAALMTATNIVPSTGQADTMIRSGYLALRAIADFYRIPPERVPSDPGELSVTRADFEQALDQLEREGIEINADRATAWAAFRGWRVNYDNAIGGLRELISDPLPHWMSHQPGAPEANSA